MATAALIQTALYWTVPFLPVEPWTLAIARKCLIPSKETKDLDFLSIEPIWDGQRLRTLLQNVDLADYNRELTNWQLDNQIYRQYVLSPVIAGSSSRNFDWRQPLWEEFYPLIRHKVFLEDAAAAVARHLHDRVAITAAPSPSDILTIWSRGVTDRKGYQIIYTAALRSVGIPAQLEKDGQVEIFSGDRWLAAPLPESILKESKGL